MNKKLRLLIIAVVVLGSLMCGYVPSHRVLHAQVVGHSVLLKWTNSPSASAISYNIYRGTASGAEVKIAQQAANTAVPTQSFTDTTATPGVLTFYFIKAADSAQVESAPSNEVSVTPLGPPAPPSGLTATDQ